MGIKTKMCKLDFESLVLGFFFVFFINTFKTNCGVWEMEEMNEKIRQQTKKVLICCFNEKNDKKKWKKSNDWV